ncbi:hypothetical protein [Hutsoniella sourekii]|uniref:hypothetical protein n=1 Tax=Hutsoniella sourekii TaxID=87650 RepID=UPI0004812145|nr:hypothetical protein [Hutsoniella sourekii]
MDDRTFKYCIVALLIMGLLSLADTVLRKPEEEAIAIAGATHATEVSAPKRVYTAKMGDDVKPEYHLIYEFEVDGEKHYYADIYRGER